MSQNCNTFIASGNKAIENSTWKSLLLPKKPKIHEPTSKRNGKKPKTTSTAIFMRKSTKRYEASCFNQYSLLGLHLRNALREEPDCADVLGPVDDAGTMLGSGGVY